MNLRLNILKPDEIQDTADKLRDYAKKLKKAEDEILYQLAELGAKEVEISYAGADEEKEYDVYFRQTENGYVIIAEGENVVFLEFGTGIDTENYPDNQFTEADVYPASWSWSEGSGTFYRYGYWHYKRKLYYGTPAYKGFYFAKKEMVEQADKIIKRVLRDL